MNRKAYPSDLSDEQWALIHPMVHETAPHTGKQPVDRREIVNAILWIVRTGAQWRYMPHDLPHWRTVYGCFTRWNGDGTWEKIEQALRPKAREASGRDPGGSLAMIDSQTVKTTESGGPRGYDGNKKMLGRKRNLVVDSIGLPITNNTMPANVHDSQPAPDLIREAKKKEPGLKMMVGDKAYNGEPVRQAAADVGIQFDVVDHENRPSKFKPVKHRWKVERSFAWHSRNRRLSKDYERTIESSEGVMAIASVGILLRRATSTRTPKNRSNTLWVFPAGLTA